MQAISHLARIAEGSLLRQSNLFEIFEVDFMLDDNLNLWFIKVNENPKYYAQNSVSEGKLFEMLNDAFEIQYKLYRSRMKRVLTLIEDMYIDQEGAEKPQLDFWRKQYQIESMNGFEPEFEMESFGSWMPILDRTQTGSDAYLGIIDDECIF